MVKKINNSISLLKEIFREIFIEEEIVLIHSSLFLFRVRELKELKEFCETLIELVGRDKTIIMPAFTPSFGKTKYWHYTESKSESGILSEYFRNKFADYRTVHPIHSLSIYNNKKNIKHNCASSFGEGSAWEWICNNNVCNLSIGVGLDGGGTICHFAEEHCNVYYRELIDLHGSVYDKNNIVINTNFKYFARKISESKKMYQNNWIKCEDDLIKSNIMKRQIYNNSIHICMTNTIDATKFIINKIQSNSNYLLEIMKEEKNKN